MRKSSIPAAWRTERIPGQIPGRQTGESRKHPNLGVDPAELREVHRLMTDVPKEVRLAQLYATPMLRPEAIVANLGMRPDQVANWVRFLDEVLRTSNPVIMRQRIHEHMRECGVAPEMRGIIQERAATFWNNRMAKSVLVYSPDELRKARQQAKGGDYYRRVKLSNGKVKYFYTEAEYKAWPGAHLSGHEVATEHAKHAVQGLVERSGPEGVGHEHLTEVAKQHGGKAVAAAVKHGLGPGGHYVWNNGRLHRREEHHSSFGPQAGHGAGEDLGYDVQKVALAKAQQLGLFSGAQRPGHKYIKREGAPGSYRYTYPDEQGRLHVFEQVATSATGAPTFAGPGGVLVHGQPGAYQVTRTKGSVQHEPDQHPTIEHAIEAAVNQRPAPPALLLTEPTVPMQSPTVPPASRVDPATITTEMLRREGHPTSTRHDVAVSRCMHHLGTKLHEWSAVPIKSVTIATDDKGKDRMMPEFSLPEGYIGAPTLYPQSTGGDMNCELCATPIKNAYWIQHDGKRWTMMVGSECVTKFGEGASGEQLSQTAIWEKNSQLLKDVKLARTRLWNDFSVDVMPYPGGHYTTKDLRHQAMRRIYDELKPLTRLKDDAKPAAVTKWARKNGEKVRELLSQLNDLYREHGAVAVAKWEREARGIEKELTYLKKTPLEREYQERRLAKINARIAELKSLIASPAPTGDVKKAERFYLLDLVKAVAGSIMPGHKYTKRWPGADGEWHYEYPPEHKYSAHKEHPEGYAPPTDRYSEERARLELRQLGDWLQSLQQASYTPEGYYEKDATGFNLFDMRSWTSLRGRLALDKPVDPDAMSGIRGLLYKYKRQLIAHEGGLDHWYRLGMEEHKHAAAAAEAESAGQNVPLKVSWSDRGGLQFKLGGGRRLSKDEFQKYLAVNQRFREQGAFASKDQLGDWVYVVPPRALDSFPFDEYRKAMLEAGVMLGDLPERKGPAAQATLDPATLSAADALAALAQKRLQNTVIVRMVDNGPRKGFIAFHSTFSREFNDIFSNKTGILTGITEYVPELQHARVTNDFGLAEEALARIREKMPQYTIVVDGAFRQAQAQAEETTKGRQAVIPEVQSKLSPDIKLFPFQNEGVRFFLDNDGKGLLGDAMGTGKTLQTLSYAAATGRRVLVVCPKVVRNNWLREAQRFFPGYFQNVKELIAAKIRTEGMPDLSKVQIATVNYEVLDKFMPAIKAAGFDLLVIDESHRAKNPKAKLTAHIQNIAAGISRRILLSGTALKNKKEELFTQLELVKPGLFASKGELQRATIGGLRHKLGQVYLARSKEDVLKQLPSKTSQIIAHEIPKSELPKAWPEDIGEISALKADLAMAKVPTTVDFAKELLESSDSNLLIFTDSVPAAEALKEKLGDVAVLHTGQTPDKTRAEALAHFDPLTRKQGDKVRVFVATTASAGIGINLQAADKVIFNDLPWTPADLRQAEDRAHRIGQVNPVNVYWQVAKDHLFDESIATTVQRKYELQKKLLEGKQLTEAEHKWMEQPISLAELRATALSGGRKVPNIVSGPEATVEQPQVELTEVGEKGHLALAVDTPLAKSLYPLPLPRFTIQAGQLCKARRAPGIPQPQPAKAPQDDEERDVRQPTPIGGITPDGYKRMAADVYVPMPVAAQAAPGAAPAAQPTQQPAMPQKTHQESTQAPQAQG